MEMSEDGRIPKVFETLMKLFSSTGEAEKLSECSINMPGDYFISEDLFMLGDIFMITYQGDEVNEGDTLDISFNIKIHPVIAANVSKFLTKHGYDVDIYQSFWFDEDGEICYEDDDVMNYELFLN